MIFHLQSTKHWLGVWTLVFLFAGKASATIAEVKQEFSKTINRAYSTTSNGMTALYNRYGKVNVHTWQENKVKIDITITVNASNQQEADEVLERINVNFTNTAGYVKAETVIADVSSSSSPWQKLTSVVRGSECDYKINYEVWMPVGNQLDLKNRYGNSFVGALNGKLYAEIKYGDLRTEALGQDADLYLGYGKANIPKINNLYGQVSYGEVQISQAREVQLDTKYSDMRIQQAAAIRITSKYDEFDFGTIEDLRVQTKYSDIKVANAQNVYFTAQYTDIQIASLQRMLDADLQYGDLKLERAGRGTEVNVMSKYTDVYIGLEAGAAHRFDIEGSYTDIKLPNSANIRHEQTSNSRKTYEGFVGDASTKGGLKLRMSYGSLTIR